jgi:hypothetical protein
MRSLLTGVGVLLFMGLATASESAAQNNKAAAMDEVFNLAFKPQSEYTSDLRGKFAQTLGNFCQSVLDALPTNTPAEDDWIASEQKSKDGAKIMRLLNSKEYSRSVLKTTFSDCKGIVTLLIEIQALPGKGTETFARLEAGQFIKLALNFEVSVESYLSKIEMNKDVKSALDDLHLHVIRRGLLQATQKALQDVR